MIFNYLYTIPNSTAGIDEIATQTVSTVSSFTPLLLAFVFFTILLGGIARQKARTGTSDYALWSVVASLGTFMVATIMTMISGMINLTWYAVIISITIASAFWLFMDRRQSEV